MVSLDLPNGVQIRDLAGVWRRSLLIDAGGQRDDTSEVYWLQVGARAGDIRARANTPHAETAFVGTLSKSGQVFTWKPIIAHGSVTDGAPDEGTLTFEGSQLREDGVHSPYVEYWQKEEIAGEHDCAMEFRAPSGTTGFLLSVGRFGFCAAPRPGGSIFVLAEHDGREHIARLCVASGQGPSLEAGAPVPWPKQTGDSLAFPEGCFGPPHTAPMKSFSLRSDTGRASQ